MNKLNDKELEKVNGGSIDSDLRADAQIYLSKAGRELVKAGQTFNAERNIQNNKICREAVNLLMEAVHYVDEGVPWNVIRTTIGNALSLINNISGNGVDEAKENIQKCCLMIDEHYHM